MNVYSFIFKKGSKSLRFKGSETEIEIEVLKITLRLRLGLILRQVRLIGSGSG